MSEGKKTFEVIMPFTGTVYARVDAKNEAEAAEIVHENAFNDVHFVATDEPGIYIDYDDVNTIDRIVSGNVCNVSPWELEVTEMEDEEQ